MVIVSVFERVEDEVGKAVKTQDSHSQWRGHVLSYPLYLQ